MIPFSLITSNMEAILNQLRDLAGKADEAGRARLVSTLKDLQIQLESPQDTFLRLYNSVCPHRDTQLPVSWTDMHPQQLELAVIYIGVDLGLFAELVKENTNPLTVAQLAERSGASPVLLGERIPYKLQSLHGTDIFLPLQRKGAPISCISWLYDQSRTESIPSEQIESCVCTPGNQAGHDPLVSNHSDRCHGKNVLALTGIDSFDILGPAIQAAPSFLAESKYQDITDGRNTPFQRAFKTDLGTFEWISQQPKLFTAMQKVMTMMQGSEWLVDFNILDEAADALGNKPESQQFERPFFVDVGGGHGHQLVQLRDKHPHLKGGLILEDLAESVEQLPEIEGIEMVTQNFFDKQNVQGMRLS